MKINKLKLSLLIPVVCSGIAVSVASAATSKVVGGKHDFSSTGLSANYKAGPGVLDNQVCIYCHTPHNAGATKLLWNKAGNGNTNFKLYTSSGTLSNATKASALTADSPSLICLSCHDGKTAMNVLHSGGVGVLANLAVPPLSGYPADSKLAFGSAPIVMETPTWMFGTYVPAAGIGDASDNLTNDHPIGFSYTGVLSEPAQAAGLWNVAQVDTNSTSRIKFFGPSSKVECSSCHDPHIDNTANPLQSPFLVMENNNSRLCLACHNK